MGARVLGSLDDLDLGSEVDLGGDLEARALVGLPGRAPKCCSLMLLESFLSLPEDRRPRLPGPAGCRL